MDPEMDVDEAPSKDETALKEANEVLRDLLVLLKVP